LEQNSRDRKIARVNRYFFLLMSPNPKMTSSAWIHPADVSSTIPQFLSTFPLMWQPAKLSAGCINAAFGFLIPLFSRFFRCASRFSTRAAQWSRIDAYAYYRIRFVSRIILDSREGASPARSAFSLASLALSPLAAAVESPLGDFADQS